MPRRFLQLFLSMIIALAPFGCRKQTEQSEQSRKADQESVSPIWALYRDLGGYGVTDADLDRGYFKADYVSRRKTAVRAGDGALQKEEVLEYALEDYEKYHEVIQKRLGVEIPWTLDDFDPRTTFDAGLREKVSSTVQAIDRLLAEAGYRRDDARYDELKAVSLFAFVLASPLGKRPTAPILSQVGAELGAARMDGVLSYILENGGLGRADVTEDCRLESGAIEALKTGCGRCSEDSKILYAVFRMAGLDARFVYGRIDYASLNDEDLTPGSLHFSVALFAPGGIRIFDVANRQTNAEQLYDRKLDWWFVGTNREILSLHYAGLCIRYVKISDPDSAIAACEKSLQLDPASFVALTNLGAAHARKRLYPQALAFYRQALAIDPGSAEAHYDLGGVYYATGEERQALESLDRALELYPDFADAHNALGAIYMERGSLDLATRHFRRALQIRPDDALFQRNLELAVEKRKRSPTH